MGTEPSEQALDFLRGLVLLPFDLDGCAEAGRIGTDLRRRGEALGVADLLIAAVTKRHGHRLLTRDKAFARVRGLLLETY